MWSSPDWYFSRAASNPSDQPRLPTTAPQIRQSTSLPPTRTRRTSRNGPSHTKPQNHTAKDPFAAAKNNTERAPRGRKPPRNRGASRPPSSLRERGFGSPRPTPARTAPNSRLAIFSCGQPSKKKPRPPRSRWSLAALGPPLGAPLYAYAQLEYAAVAALNYCVLASRTAKTSSSSN